MLACLEYCFILDERLHPKKFLVLQDYETLNGERSCCCFKHLNKIQTFQLNESQHLLPTANFEIKTVTVSFPQDCLGLFCTHRLLMLLRRGSTVFFAMLLRALINMFVLLVGKLGLSFEVGLLQQRSHFMRLLFVFV